MPTNAIALKAREQKRDEFYTLLPTIEEELVHYDLRGMCVYCPCDDYNTSNFWKYFHDNFSKLGLRKLVATCYNGEDEQVDLLYGCGLEQNPRRAKIAVQDCNGTRYGVLYGNGDFRSDECRSIMSECDVVVTNPPFSLWRYLYKQIGELGKHFLIMGTINSLVYSCVREDFVRGTLRLGYTLHSGDVCFRVPDDYPFTTNNYSIVDGERRIRVPGIRWYTDLPTGWVPPFWHTDVKFGDVQYRTIPKHGAINVNDVHQIPENYYGSMGVPITFADKLNRNQYEVLTIQQNPKLNDGREIYSRLIIKRR